MTQLGRKMDTKRSLLVRELNDFLTCSLCNGYLIDATTLVECYHIFCRSCILRYFENCKTECPNCNKVYKKTSQVWYRSDPQIQSMVYKIVPGLYSKEMQRREDFYRSTAVRASSSCSDDSVLERERDSLQEQDEAVQSYIGDKSQFFSPDDTISLSLEYYQMHLDDTSVEDAKPPPIVKLTSSEETDLSGGDLNDQTCAEKVTMTTNDPVQNASETKQEPIGCEVKKEDGLKESKRYLQCPAAVSMKHLQKFIRMKFALTNEHRVDIIYRGEVLPLHFSLMDVAYTFKWKRLKPMRFFYRIFTPLKIRPFKIINTSSSSGGKQLQVVPIKPSTEPRQCDASKATNKNSKPDGEDANEKDGEKLRKSKEKDDHEQQDRKERLMAHLQLQSKAKVQSAAAATATATATNKVPEMSNKTLADCIYTYEEPDKEEIKRFAEKRDREWAMQKKLDEEYHNSHHFSKKRKKKDKHSRNDSKKRKLHAEITSNENNKEDLKLKVKLTPHNPHNGHKHKHHKNVQQFDATVLPPTKVTHQEKAESKESLKAKLIQLRQVRHKHIGSEDKNVQTVIDPKSQPQQHHHHHEDSEPVKKAQAQQQQQNNNNQAPEASNKKKETSSSSHPSSDDAVKVSREKVPTIHLERSLLIKQKEQQKTFLKTFQSYTEKVKLQQQIQQKSEKLNQNQLHKILDKKIATLQQQCTKGSTSGTGTSTSSSAGTSTNPKSDMKQETNNILNNSYHSGFTVSKIEAGVKRKLPDEDERNKRPSLEITLINPPASSPKVHQQKLPLPPLTLSPVAPPAPAPAPTPPAAEIIKTAPTNKRPPPATIPLDRIKKSNLNNSKSGISIIPKLPEKCDNIGALDLSKPSKSPETAKPPGAEIKPINGFNAASATAQRNVHNSTPRPPQSMQLSNLQMLSKVAIEHSSQIKPANVKPKPPVPTLQTLKPSAQGTGGQAGPKQPPNLAKMPKLNEINKAQFRLMNPQIRNLRPNQNQNIRNIPNPSLIVRLQNQNRINNINQITTGTGTKTVGATGTGDAVRKNSASGSGSGSSQTGHQEKSNDSKAVSTGVGAGSASAGVGVGTSSTGISVSTKTNTGNSSGSATSTGSGTGTSAGAGASASGSVKGDSKEISVGQ